jgi:hypothetical protein
MLQNQKSDYCTGRKAGWGASLGFLKKPSGNGMGVRLAPAPISP